MNRLLRCCIPVVCAGLVPVLAAPAQTTPAPAESHVQSAVAEPQNAPGFKNLKVLPDTISRDDLRKLMRQFSGDLGVECEFCHAAADPVTRRADRASDANPVKETARYMIQMTDDINTKYLAQIKDRHDTNPVTCGTCHRGEKHPSVFIPPPRQERNRPPGAPPSAVPPGSAPPVAMPPA